MRISDWSSDVCSSDLTALKAEGVTLHADERARPYDDTALPVTDEDWAAEYLSLDLAVGVVDSLDEAVTHIRRWGSGHTQAIRSEERPVGKARGRTGRSRWSP